MITLTKRLNWAAALLLASAAGLSLTSCDNNLIYDDLAPCEVKHAVRFQWTRNMIGADGFANNVHSVSVYVFDENDKYVTTFSEAGEKLAMQGYTLALEGLAPGDYTLVAWCGLNNEGTRAESFNVDDVIPGETSRRDMLCKLRRDIRPDGTHHSSEELYDLYHGTAYGVTIYPAEAGSMLGDHIYTIDLTKDTNAVAVQLVNINGEELDINKFAFTIEETNGTLKPDNTTDDTDETINYHEFENFQGDITLETRGFPVNPITRAIATRSVSATGGGLLNMSRLMADKHANLSVYNTETGERVFTVSLIQVATNDQNMDMTGRHLTQQEYLDNQDRYRLDLFLQNGQWLNASVMINSWTVILQNADFQ